MSADKWIVACIDDVRKIIIAAFPAPGSARKCIVNSWSTSTKKMAIFGNESKENKSSAVAEMGDRGHNRHGPKRGGVAVPISRGELGPRLTQCGLGRGLFPYQVASSSIQPFGHNRHGLCPFLWGGELAPHLKAWFHVRINYFKEF